MSLPRAKSSHYLKLFLCAMLACPANVPTSELEGLGANAESPTSTPTSASSRPGLCLHKPDRKPSHRLTDWSVLADEPEGCTDLDDFRLAPLALPHRPLDLPSLVPAPLDSRPPGRAAAVASSAYSPPLRC